MSREKLCQQFLRAAATLVRRVGLARGIRKNLRGQVCMLGAMDYCGISIGRDERSRIEEHLASLLPPIAIEVVDDHNGSVYPNSCPSLKIAYWSNMVAQNEREVADMLEKAAEHC